MKSSTTIPPMSRSLIWRAISGTASKFVLSAMSSKSAPSSRVRPELTSMATRASVWSITIEPPDGSSTLRTNRRSKSCSIPKVWNRGRAPSCRRMRSTCSGMSFSVNFTIWSKTSGSSTITSSVREENRSRIVRIETSDSW